MIGWNQLCWDGERVTRDFFFFFFFYLSFSFFSYRYLFARFSSSFSPIDTELWVLIEKHAWKKKQRGKREEKKKKRGILAAEISGIVICSITNRRERGIGGILLTNCRHLGFYVVSGALDLSCFSINRKMICWLMDYNMPPCLGTWKKERREKGKGRLQVTMNWISGTLMDAFVVFLEIYPWTFGCVFVICLLT